MATEKDKMIEEAVDEVQKLLKGEDTGAILHSSNNPNKEAEDDLTQRSFVMKAYSKLVKQYENVCKELSK